MRIRSALLAGAALCALAACGTRLPDHSFGPTIVATPVAAGGADAAAVGSDASAVPDSAGDAGSDTAAAAGETLPPGVTALGPGLAQASAAPGVVRASGAAKASAVAVAGKAPAAKGSTATTKANYASDIGVTATSITLGNIVSAGGIFGDEEFSKQQYGMRAYFADLNTKGGLNGRKIIVNPYNDNGDGDQNVAVVKQAINDDKDFAFVGNNVYTYDGSKLVNDAGMPDIAGEPIDGGAYNKWRHFWPYGGSSYPRDDKQAGYPDGADYGGSEIGNFFKSTLGVQAAGVVYYDQEDSYRGAQEFQREFQAAGVKTTLYPVNLGLPNFSNTVAQMQSDGVSLVTDALDANGNAKLCGAIESNSTFLDQMKVKLSNVSTWVQDIQSQFKQSPKCRAKIYVSDSTWNFSDTSNPGVAAFRAAMKKYFSSREGLDAEWSLHGWVAGLWFTAAAKPCGADLTRACLEKNMASLVFDGGGLITKSNFMYKPESDYTQPGAMSSDCLSIAQWNDTADRWDTKADVTHNCYTSPYTVYRPNG